MRALPLVAVLLLTGCWNFEAAWNAAYDAGTSPGTDSGVPDAGPVDSGTSDAGDVDAGDVDAGAPDAGEPDAGTPDAGPASCVGGCGTSQACVDGVCRAPIALTAGENFTCALLDGGSVWCWGANGYGQLGSDAGTTTFPARVAGLPSVTQISAGLRHVCAVTDTGAIWCWGDAELLATGHPGSQVAPLSTALTNQVQVAAGATHTCAVDLGGGLHCWGDNRALQLGVDVGDGPFEAPVELAASGYASVSTGDGFSCAIKANTQVVCWGKDRVMGNGSADGGLPGVTVRFNGTSALNNVQAICTGADFGCAISPAVQGKLACWGDNTFTQVEEDSAVGSLALYAAGSLNWGMAELSCGARHACAIVTYSGGADTPDVRCWGDDADYQLADPSGGHSSPWSSNIVSFNGDEPQHVAAGATHGCELTASNKIYCWGSINTSDTPVKVNFLP